MGIIKKRITGINPTGIFERAELKLISTGLLCAASIFAAAIAYPAEIKKPPSQPCEPKREQVAVKSVSGRCAVKGLGIYSTTSAIGLGDEPMKWIMIGAFAIATVCGVEEKGWDLECKTGDYPSLAGKFWEISGSRPWTFLQVASSRWDLECRPKDTEVTISGPDMSLRGPCIRLGPGTYKTPKELGVGDPTFGMDRRQYNRVRKEGTLLFKDRPCIVQLGSSVRAKMCSEDNFSGRCTNGQERRLYQSKTIEPVLVGSMKVWKVCERRVDEVALFGDPDAWGPYTIRKAGEYLTAESLGMEGDAIRAIYVGVGVDARVCSDENMKGDCADITGYNRVDWTIRSLRVRSHY